MESTVLYTFLAAGAGLLIGYLLASVLASAKYRKASDDWSAKVQLERDELSRRDMEIARLSEQVSSLQERLREAADQIDGERGRSESLQLKLTESQKSISSGQAENANLMKRLDEERQRIEEDKLRMKQEFENLANQILDAKVQKFTTMNSERLGEVIAPFKEKLAEFEQKIDSTNKEQNEGRAALFERLKSLEELNKSLSAEAINLTQALRGDNKAAGDWGEMVLERILQDSGLSEGTHYKLQESFTGDNGRQRPDAVIYLPDNKNLIIDSKVSLKAYSDWAGASDDAERDRHRKEHFTSVKSHMAGLVSRKYTDIEGLSTPDFIIMFIPNDAAFMLALQHDRTLYDQAYKQRVTIVGPSNLMAVMMTIDHLWKQENQRKNMLEIAARGEALLDKFSGFIESMDEIGNRLGQAEKAYVDAKTKLYTGNGSLVRQATMLRDLGVKAKKQLPEAE
jgi:DNA recombination protein RmuC